MYISMRLCDIYVKNKTLYSVLGRVFIDREIKYISQQLIDFIDKLNVNLSNFIDI